VCPSAHHRIGCVAAVVDQFEPSGDQRAEHWLNTIPGVNACTIVRRRGLARARVLVSTFHEHHPGESFTVLVLDGAASIAGARILGLHEVVGDEGELIAAANPPGALDAAVLPYLLRMLANERPGPVVYLAPGLRVLCPIDELVRLLDDHEIAIVPRLVAEHYSAARSMTGAPLGSVFSHRLLGLRPGPAAERLLSEWPRYFTPAAGDDDGGVRAWFDGLPAIAENVGVLRDPRYGLDPRTLRDWSAASDGDALLIAGESARTFDFTDMDPEHPMRLFDGDAAARISFVPALARLAERHASELLAAGYADDARRPLGFVELGDGVRLSPAIRKLLVRALSTGVVTESPFTERGRRELYAYLNEPAERGRSLGLTRLHMQIWDDSRALQSAYPHVDGPDGAGFAGWLHVYGPAEHGLAPPLLPPTPDLVWRDSDSHVQLSPPLWGVNVAGFFNSELGIGEAARLLIAALDARGIPALPVQGRLRPPSRQEAEFDCVGADAAAYPINIVCMNGDTIPIFAREAGRSFFEGRHTIALWWWEVGEIPVGWEDSFEHIDEVWVGSQHIYDAVSPSSPVPVVKVTMPVLMPRVPRRSRGELGLPEGFLFLYVHDYQSIAARKNPVGVIEAFKRAFVPGSGAKLVVKSINAGLRRDDHDRVLLAAADHPDIILIDAYVAAADKNAIIAACDCYVSLHRSEGFGLTLAEAMLLGKPVVATRYGGTLEFTDETNAYLVDWKPVEVGERAYPYPARALWAEPDLDHAATLMWRVFAERAEARARGASARRHILQRHSPVVAGESIEVRLRAIHERRFQEGARSLNLAHVHPLEPDDSSGVASAQIKIDWGSGRRAHWRWRLTRPLVEWMRASIAHQREIDRRLDARLREIARATQDQQHAQLAGTLAALRELRTELADLRASLEERDRQGTGEEQHQTYPVAAVERALDE
jgi:glycosyltransferase involved in cell wall biosynthesis